LGAFTGESEATAAGDIIPHTTPLYELGVGKNIDMRMAWNNAWIEPYAARRHARIFRAVGTVSSYELGQGKV